MNNRNCIKKDFWAYYRENFDFGKGVTILLDDEDGVGLLYTNKMPKLRFVVNNNPRVLDVEWSAGESDDSRLEHYMFSKTRAA